MFSILTWGSGVLIISGVSCNALSAELCSTNGMIGRFSWLIAQLQYAHVTDKEENFRRMITDRLSYLKNVQRLVVFVM